MKNLITVFAVSLLLAGCAQPIYTSWKRIEATPPDVITSSPAAQGRLRSDLAECGIYVNSARVAKTENKGAAFPVTSDSWTLMQACMRFRGWEYTSSGYAFPEELQTSIDPYAGLPAAQANSEQTAPVAPLEVVNETPPAPTGQKVIWVPESYYDQPESTPVMPAPVTAEAMPNVASAEPEVAPTYEEPGFRYYAPTAQGTSGTSEKPIEIK